LPRLGLLLIIIGSVLWGTDSIFRQPLTRNYAPVTIVFLEHCVLVAVMLPSLVSARKEILAFQSRDWIALIFIAAGGSVAATSLFTFSIKYGNPSVAVLLQKTQPVFTTLLARWSLHEIPGKWFWKWFPPALVGAYLVSTPDWRTGFRLDSSLAGSSILAALGAALLWGSSTVFGRYVAGRISTSAITGLRFLIALPILGALFWSQPAPARTLPSSLHSILSLTAMALIPGLLALIFYYKGLISTIAPLASIGELAFPVTAVATNWVFLGVKLSSSQMTGAAILVSAITALSYLNARDKALSSQTCSPETPSLERRSS
jgi:drug/metabolite transporter (DMT)-like permease